MGCKGLIGDGVYKDGSRLAMAQRGHCEDEQDPVSHEEGTDPGTMATLSPLIGDMLAAETALIQYVDDGAVSGQHR